MRSFRFGGIGLIIQLLNIVFILGIIAGVIFMIHFLIVKLPKNLKERNETLINIEKILNEINKKIDNKL